MTIQKFLHRFLLLFFFLNFSLGLFSQAPAISSFSPSSGVVGSLVTVSGTDLNNPTSLLIGGVPAIVISNTGSSLVAMVMPGATTGGVSITTAGGSSNATGSFTVTTRQAPSVQQGNKLVGTGSVGMTRQGGVVALSADGNTAIVGGMYNNSNEGGAWVYTRSGNTWAQQGGKLLGTGAVGAAYQGSSVAISADGNKVVIGGFGDNASQGAVWIFTRSGNVWSQEGNKLVGTGGIGLGKQGGAVGMSGDGNTIIVGGWGDNNEQGAAWVFKWTGSVWVQQGNKLVGTGAVGNAQQGMSVGLSADGRTAIIGGMADNSSQGGAWIFTGDGLGNWTQEGNKLVGTGAVGAARQGVSVAISADGNTAIVGGNYDNGSQGAAWVYTRSGNTWSQQGNKLVGSGASGTFIYQGQSVSISADGNTVVIGGPSDNNAQGASWVFTRSGNAWTQQGTKLVGSGSIGPLVGQGSGVALSADGRTMMLGGYYDDNDLGAAWAFTHLPVQTTPAISSFSPSSGVVGSLVTVSGTDLNNPTSLLIGGVPAIVISNTGSSLVAMVMPGATTGGVSITTAGGSSNATGSFTVTTRQAPSVQQGNKLVGTGSVGMTRQGGVVALSADGNTAIVGGMYNNSNEGGAWVYTRSGNTWAQQGGKLLGTGAVGAAYQGSSVAISADGNKVVIGGFGDNASQGAVWIFTRSGNVWSQEGNKLVGTGGIGLGKQGGAVGMSGDGNTIIVGGWGDNNEQGAAWVFKWTGSVWVQQGNKLVGTGAVGNAQQGMSVGLSADGRTAIIGGMADNSSQGGAWIFTGDGLGNWTQEGNKLVGTGAVGAARQGVSVAISADGNTAIVGGNYDNGSQGAAWVYTRSGNTWSQQGNKLVGSGASGTFIYQGQSVSISADGNTVVIGGPSDNNAQGASWVFTRSGNAWTQQGTKLVGSGSIGPLVGQGSGVALSADGRTMMLGGYYDDNDLGAAWVYTSLPSPSMSSTSNLTAFNSCVGSVSTEQSFTVNGYDLTTDIIITPPAGFELSLTTGSGFGNNVSLTPVSGYVNNTTLYIRLTNAASGSPAGNIILTSTGATTQNIAVSGTVNALPTITLGSVANVNTSATNFNLPYSAVTGSPNQYSITTGSPIALPGFVAITNASLAASPISVAIPASASNTYHFVATVRNSVTGCVSASTPFTVQIAANNADLSSLTMSTGTFTPAFLSGTTSYTGTVANGTSSISVTPTKSHTNAIIEVRVNGGAFTAVNSGNPSSSLALIIGANTIDVRVTAEDGITQKTYSIAILVDPIVVGPVGGGGGGGVESKSLGDAIAARIFNSAINNIAALVDYNTLPSASNQNIFTNYSIGTQLKLTDILPTVLANHNYKSFISTPKDLIGITNAKEVLSIDFVDNNTAKAVAFGTKTLGDVYDHTKAICDRLKGYELVGLQNINIGGVNMIQYNLKNNKGNIEYAMSFIIGAKAGRPSYTIQSNWLNKDYTRDEVMYNIQLWGGSPSLSVDMAKDIISRLTRGLPVQEIKSNVSLPKTYITEGNRIDDFLNLTIQNNSALSTGYFEIRDRANEQVTNRVVRVIPVTIGANGKTEIKVPTGDLYESTIGLYINGKLEDEVFMADGSWGVDYNTNTTSLKSFKVSNSSTPIKKDEFTLFRNASVAASTPDVVSVYKLLRGGGTPQDLTAYKTLKLTASANTALNITLLKESITNWKDQYTLQLPVGKDPEAYYISLTDFKSTRFTTPVVPNDITSLVITVGSSSVGSLTNVEASFSNISFIKDDIAYIRSLSAREVSVYPNPSKGAFNVKFKADNTYALTLKITEASTGKVIMTKPVNAVFGENSLPVEIANRYLQKAYIINLEGSKVKYKPFTLIMANE